MVELDESESRLVETAREEILKHAKKRRNEGLYDVLYAFMLSESGEIYSGKPFESSQPSFNFCAERDAINRMQYEENEESEIEAVLVAGPVPNEDEHVTMPCGACRHAINEFGTKETTVLASNFVRQEDGEWNMFPKIEKFSIEKIYPKAYDPVKWD